MINNKIKNLTKIFLRDYIEKLNIKDEKNKINKKSSTIWLGSILIFCITYISVYLISNLKNQNTPEIFFKIYLPIIAILMLYQLAMLVCNLFFYSKDIEYIKRRDTILAIYDYIERYKITGNIWLRNQDKNLNAENFGKTMKLFLNLKDNN